MKKTNRMNEKFQKIYDLTYSQKKYNEAILEIEKDWVKKNNDICLIEAFCLFETKQYDKAAELYKKLNLPFQEGFCYLLTGNITKAKEIWNKTPDSSAVLWGQTVIGIIESKINHFPTYFQIRNYLESTLSYLFEAKRYDYIEKLISAKEFLAEFNIESYRIIGKVLLEYNWFNLSKQYLEKSVGELPQDYEAYYLLGLWYYQNNEPKKAKYFLRRCVDINDYYCAASKLIDKINEID